MGTKETRAPMGASWWTPRGPPLTGLVDDLRGVGPQESGFHTSRPSHIPPVLFRQNIPDVCRETGCRG